MVSWESEEYLSTRRSLELLSNFFTLDHIMWRLDHSIQQNISDTVAETNRGVALFHHHVSDIGHSA